MASGVRCPTMPTSVVLNELDEFAKQWDMIRKVDGGWECRRARARRQFRTSCEIWYFENCGRSVCNQFALTRNLSEQGIGLLTKCVVLQGVPVEIRICVPAHPPLYMAGVTVFCRYTQRSYHEVGIALKTCQGRPIWGQDPLLALGSLPWLQQAIRNLRLASDVGKALPQPVC
jgi:hypothetical protein